MAASKRRIAFLERCKKWVLANPTASIAETMRATLANQGTVSLIRKELIAAGMLSKFPHAREPMEMAPNRAEKPAPPVLSTSELLAGADAVIEGTEPMTREARRKRLELLVRIGQPDHIIRASAALENMERQDSGREDIGPPPPSTLEEGVDQVSDMIEALASWGGEDAVRKAVSRGMERHLENQKLISQAVTVQPDLMGVNQEA